MINYNFLDHWKALLDGPITTSAVSITLKNVENLPTTNFILSLKEYDGLTLIKNERIFVSTRSWNTLSWITRGYAGTTPKAFADGDECELNFVAEHFNNLQTALSEKANLEGGNSFSGNQIINFANWSSFQTKENDYYNGMLNEMYTEEVNDWDDDWEMRLSHYYRNNATWWDMNYTIYWYPIKNGSIESYDQLVKYEYDINTAEWNIFNGKNTYLRQFWYWTEAWKYRFAFNQYGNWTANDRMYISMSDNAWNWLWNPIEIDNFVTGTRQVRLWYGLKLSPTATPTSASWLSAWTVYKDSNGFLKMV